MDAAGGAGVGGWEYVGADGGDVAGAAVSDGAEVGAEVGAGVALAGGGDGAVILNVVVPVCRSPSSVEKLVQRTL